MKTQNPASQPIQMAAVLASDLANVENWRTPGRIMGLDLELVNTGIVILTDRGLVLRSGTIRSPLVSKKGRPPISERDRVDRILNLANDIIGTAKKFSIQHIVIESGGASFGGKKVQSQTFQRGGLAYVVMTQLWLACHLFPELVEASSARKRVLGYGHAKKPQIELALKLNEVEVDTDHEADAYVVSRWLFEKIKEKP